METLVTLNELAKQMGVTPSRVKRWGVKGWIELQNIAGRNFVTPTSIENFHKRAEAGEFKRIRVAKNGESLRRYWIKKKSLQTDAPVVADVT